MPVSRTVQDVSLGFDEEHAFYYDRNRFAFAHEARRAGRWYVITADWKAEDGSIMETGEIIDVTARDRREASLVARAAFAHDYEPGAVIRSIELA